ncbi:MAG TPA: alpha-L-fucosidase [Gemmatimonadaceae bacterium]|nr:alpha-L-fucosidase [Gemmatimonadaceae bacterium]
MERRDFIYTIGGAVVGSRLRWPVPGPTRAVPTAAQLQWQRDELAMFLHFGVNTFTDREWGDGTEDPAIFAPTALDAREWARSAKRGGFRTLILTAKHHDGFCLWPTRTTEHSVAKSPWRGGQGDVVRELVDACRAEGLRAGVYLSPWDRNNPTYGTGARYNDLYCDQLTELLTRYGDIAEVWFDGANGEGPNGKRQAYDWPRVWALVRRLQPNAVMFSDAGPDLRWCGNENGSAGDPNWSTVDPGVVPYPGASGAGVTAALQHGDPNGAVWRPAEADVSIRKGWFYHPADDDRVKSIDELSDLYFTSVGRNAKLLLNVPPTRAGLLRDVDVRRLAGFRDRLQSLFEVDHAVGVPARWSRAVGGRAEGHIDLPAPASIAIARLEEPIERGQTIAAYALHGSVKPASQSSSGDWRLLAKGSTIGNAKLDRFAPTTVRSVRLSIDAAPEPASSIGIRLY